MGIFCQQLLRKITVGCAYYRREDEPEIQFAFKAILKKVLVYGQTFGISIYDYSYE